MKIKDIFVKHFLFVILRLPLWKKYFISNDTSSFVSKSNKREI